MKKNYLIKLKLLCFFLVASYAASAQTGSISGRVLDETNQPLPGASVSIQGADRSTSTDSNGNFKINGINNGTQTIIINFIGYQQLTKTVNINGGGGGGGSVAVNLKLQPSSQTLNDVVVIGYGTQQKKGLTGAITTVTSKDFVKAQVTSPEQLIIGKVAGVQITTNSGAPGSGSVIRIRGGASLNASNDPLIVIDGNPFNGATIGNVANPLSLINPNDIESFTILKDANATAIYGSRASNGVILITTKRGGSGEPVINFNTSNSYSTIAKEVNVLSADQIRAYVNTNGTAAQKALLGTANTNWQDEIYNNAFSTDNNVSVAGAFQRVPYRFSVGHLDQKGILITDALRRSTGALTLSPKLFTNHLKVDLTLNGSLSDSHFANADAVGAALQFDPTQPVHATNSFGNYFEWISGGTPNPNAPRNPVALIKLKDNNGSANRSFGDMHLDYSFHFLPELHANVNLGYDIARSNGLVTVPDFAAQSASTKGSITQSLEKQKNLFSEAYLSYAKDLSGINSNINMTAGYGYYDNSKTTYNFSSRKASGEVITAPVYPYATDRDKLLSYYGRLVYTLASKYILSGTMRADGSSKFSEDNRWGYFPSAGFTWRLIDESFLKDSKTFSDLKLRLSYGETGNKDGIGDYDYLSKYYGNTNTGQYQIGDTFYNYYSPAAYDPDLKWETTTTYNAGLDYGFAKNRVYGSIDVYYKQTKDLLSTIDIPTGTNFSNRLTTNVGNMENRGIEASINLAAIRTNNVNWDFGFNVAYNKRKVTNLTLNPDPNFKIDAGGIAGGTGTNIKYNTIDQTPGSFYVYKQVYDTNGKPLEGVYEDLNGDGTINSNDQYFYKAPEPKFIVGFTTSFNYRKLTLSTVLRANLDNYVYDNVSSNFGIKKNILSPSGIINNAGIDIYNTNFSDPQYLSDYYVKNASFLKMDNLSLSFDVGKLSKNNRTTLRISANCQNVFTVTQYKGIDPELTDGIDYKLYPRPRTYTLGVNVGF